MSKDLVNFFALLGMIYTAVGIPMAVLGFKALRGEEHETKDCN